MFRVSQASVDGVQVSFGEMEASIWLPAQGLARVPRGTLSSRPKLVTLLAASVLVALLRVPRGTRAVRRSIARAECIEIVHSKK